MNDAKRHEIEQWLIKADHDLLSAQCLLEKDPPLLATAVYHCQQAAEKALKAFLTHHDSIFQKTHHLPLLVEQSAAIDSTFSTILDIADELTPYATAFRYPGEVIAPELEEVVLALKQARQIESFVRQRICDI